MATIVQPNGKSIEVSSTKGKQYAEEHGIVEWFDEFCKLIGKWLLIALQF